jgi:hypothetical protein
MKLKSLTNKDRYGNMFSVEFFEPQTSVPMMMLIPEMEEGYNGATVEGHPGDPKGTDTVPAWLTPGENVVNAEASRIPGNQEMIDQMNAEGQAIQQAQGGPIPTYESDGGMIPPIYAQEGETVLPLGLRQNNPGNIRSGGDNWLGLTEGGNEGYAQFESPEYGLRAMARTLGTYADTHDIGTIDGLINRYAPEGDNTEESRANYKSVLADTLGVGINDPIDLKAARNQLMPAMIGFENANNMPYTQDQINMAIQAAGTDDPAVVKEILDNKAMVNAEKPSAFDRVISLVGDAVSAVNPISTAEAQTNVPPITNVPPTGSRGSGEYLPNAAEQAAGMRFNEAIPEYMRNNKMEGKTDYGDVIYDSDGTPQAVNPNRISPEAKQKIIDKFVENNDQEMYDRRMAEYEQAVKQDEAHKKYKSDQAELEKTQETNERNETIATLEDRRDQAIIDGDDDLAAALQKEIDGVPPIEGVPPTNNAPADTDDTSLNPIVNNIIAEGSQEKQPDSDNTSEDEVINAGKNAPDSLKETFKQGFINAFGDLFSAKELARMAILYTGSRILGYSHNGSLAYGAKSYISRIDARDKQEYELVKANAKNYTTESFNKYIETRDMDDLIPVVEVKKRKAGDYLYVPRAGGNVPSIDVEGVPHVSVRDINGPDGKPDGKVDSYDLENAINVGGVKTVDNIHNPTTVEAEFSKTLSDLESTINKRRGVGNKGSDAVALGLNDPVVASAAMTLYFQDLQDFSADPAKAYMLKGQMKEAIREWSEAMAAYANDPSSMDDPSKSLSAYYFKRRIKDRVDVSASAFGDTTPEKMVEIYRDTSAGLNDLQTQTVYKRALRLYNIAKQNKIDMKGFDFKGTNDVGYNGFAFFLHQLNQGDDRAIAVFNAAKKFETKKE